MVKFFLIFRGFFFKNSAKKIANFFLIFRGFFFKNPAKKNPAKKIPRKKNPTAAAAAILFFEQN